MRGVLPAYLRRRVATHTLALVAIFTALMQVLELLDVTTDVLERGLGVTGILYYAMLRMPSEIVLALPLAALFGAMSALHALARSHEMVPIRTAGLSLSRIAVLLLPVPLLIAAMHVALAQSIVPLAEATLKSWWEASAPPEDSPERRWVRTSDGPVSFARADPDGRRLTDVRIYQRGEDRLLSARVSARVARWEGGDWRLEGIGELDVAGGRVLRRADDARVWKTNLHPDDVRRVDVAQPRLSSIMLVDVLAGERVGTQPLSYYQTALYRSFMTPLAAFIMLLLALPTARGLPRTDGEGGLLAPLGLGLGFLLCDGFMAALGTSGRAPAIAAALAAPLVFAAIGLARLRASERR